MTGIETVKAYVGDGGHLYDNPRTAAASKIMRILGPNLQHRAALLIVDNAQEIIPLLESTLEGES